MDKRNQAVTEQLEGYRTIIDHLTIPFAHITPSGDIISSNAVWAALFAKSPENIVGKSLYDLLPHSAGKLSSRIRLTVESGNAQYAKDCFTLATGKCWFRSELQPITQNSGEVTYSGDPDRDQSVAGG